MSSCVIDSSAILAVAFDEVGKEFVKSRLSGALLSTVNLQEVFEKLAERQRPTEGLTARIERMQVRIIEYSPRQAELAAAMTPLCKPKNISLADRACLALGKDCGLPVLTADRSWATVEHGVVVELIR